MKPFFLRRLKSDVLTDLPAKILSLEKVPMSEKQSQIYFKLVSDYKDRAAKVRHVLINKNYEMKQLIADSLQLERRSVS